MGQLFGARRSHLHPTAGLVAPPPGAPGTIGIAYPSTLPTMAVVADLTVDLRKIYAGPINNQLQLERCVGEGVREANDHAIRGAGPQVSDLAVWHDALAIEGSRTGGQFLNVGCDTVDAYNAAVSRGWRARDANDDDPTRALAPDSVDELVARVRAPLDCFAPLADGDQDSMQKWATVGCCSTFTSWVGPAYSACSAQNPIWNGETSSDNGGYHRQLYKGMTSIVVAGVATPFVVTQGSWGADFGEGGYVYVPVATFAKLVVEPVVHRGGLVLQGAQS